MKIFLGALLFSFSFSLFSMSKMMGELSEDKAERIYKKVTSDKALFSKMISDINAEKDNACQDRESKEDMTAENFIDNKKCANEIAEYLYKKTIDGEIESDKFLKDGKKEENIYATESVKKEDSETLKALSNFLEKQLKEALYGEKENSEKKAGDPTELADHEVFYTMIQSSLGKSLIAQLSNYCLDTVTLAITQNQGESQISIDDTTYKVKVGGGKDPYERSVNITKLGESENNYNKNNTDSGKDDEDENDEKTEQSVGLSLKLNEMPADEEARLVIRKANIKALASTGAGGSNQAFDGFNHCIQTIKYVAADVDKCEGGANYVLENEKSEEEYKADKIEKKCANGKAEDNGNFSSFSAEQRAKANVVVHNMEKIRVSLLSIEETKEVLEGKEMAKNSEIGLDAGSHNVKIYNGGNKKDFTIEKITQITSGEYLHRAKNEKGESIKEIAEKQKGAVEESCNGSMEACEKILYGGKDKERFLATYSEGKARASVTAGSIAKMDSTEFKKHLEESGYSKEKIQKMMTGGSEDMVIKRYAQELKDKKAAIVQKDYDKYKDLFLQGKDMSKADWDKLKKAGKRKMDELGEGAAETLHYAGIISGYFKFENSDGATNIDAAKDEVEDSYLKLGNRSPSGEEEDPYANFAESTKDLKSGKRDSAVLTSDQIESLLDLAGEEEK